MRAFVDSTVPMYVAGAAHPNRASAVKFMERVRSGEVEACTSTEVLQEILCRYTALARVDATFDRGFERVGRVTLHPLA